jgi:very-short-patch-repair endonuclease
MKNQIENFVQDSETGLFICPVCGKQFVKKGISSHVWRHYDGKNFAPLPKDKENKKPIWNKGRTKEDHPSLKKASETFSKKFQNGELKVWSEGSRLPESTRKKISDSMTIAHREGRAWNIGSSRWNNEPSYPERFFMEVIENEFDDKEYVREYPFSIYSIDFAWPHKKLAIEIDGEQHERFEEYKERDRKKDELLNLDGWKVLRIKWKDFVKDTKKYIKLSNEFISF